MFRKRVLNSNIKKVNGDIYWTTKGMVTQIKNQHQCGGCWAFSATGVLESYVRINKGQAVFS